MYEYKSVLSLFTFRTFPTAASLCPRRECDIGVGTSHRETTARSRNSTRPSVTSLRMSTSSVDNLVLELTFHVVTLLRFIADGQAKSSTVLLDDPEMQTGKHRTLVTHSSFKVHSTRTRPFFIPRTCTTRVFVWLHLIASAAASWLPFRRPSSATLARPTSSARWTPSSGSASRGSASRSASCGVWSATWRRLEIQRLDGFNVKLCGYDKTPTIDVTLLWEYCCSTSRLGSFTCLRWLWFWKPPN